jgi:deoxyribodipyrimidine photolyase-like uncharacterized protein
MLKDNTVKKVLQKMKDHCKKCPYYNECKKGNIVPNVQIARYLEEIYHLEKLIKKDENQPYEQQNYC